MKNKLLLSVFVLLSSCSASDTPSCVSPRCKFTKDLSSNKFFYFSNVDVNCETKIPSAETLKKLQDTQTDPIYFCGCD